MTPFLLDMRHWPTVADFEAHLGGYDPTITAPWAKGLTYHHTYRPLASQWTGAPSIQGLKRTYLAKKPTPWDRGPHLVIVWGSPDPANDGIWQFTPLDVPGIHAGACNPTHWGIEVAGDYDDAPWPTGVRDLALGAGAALLRWKGIGVDGYTVRGHKECLANKSCPGDAVRMADVRTALALLLNAGPDTPIIGTTITADSSIISAPSGTQEQIAAYLHTYPHPNYKTYDIDLSIVPGYWSICTSVGVDPIKAAAQMIHEGAMSSFWGARPQRNPAGIGVNGTHAATKPADQDDWAYNPDRQRWERGLSFASWIGHAIPAHVGRLVAYATTPEARTPAQFALAATALQVRPLPVLFHGSAPTLKALGNAHNPHGARGAGWALPGLDYGARIAAIANQIRGIR
jgi:hypothetical protein